MARDVSGVTVNIGHAGGPKYGSAQLDNRSELLKAQAISNGEPVNFCPFNCLDEELDEHGYCYHLIGFSPDGKKLERNEVDKDGRLRTKAVLEKIKGKPQFVHPERVNRKIHVLVPVTIGGTSRVYQDVPRPEGVPEPEHDELSDEELAQIDAEEAEDLDDEDLEEATRPTTT